MSQSGSPYLYGACMRRTLIAVALLATLSACGNGTADNHPAPAAISPSVQLTVAPPAPSTNVETDTACKLVDEATRSELDNGLEDRSTVEAIARKATGSNLESVKLAGVQLDGRYSAWSREDGGGASRQDLRDAANRLKVACSDAGVID